MSTPKVSRAKVVPLRPGNEPVTLADITVIWGEGDETKRATGAQIARLLTLASFRAPSGLFATGHDAGRAVPLLKGLSDLVFPDPRALDDLRPDTRYMISEVLEEISAIIHTDALEHPCRATGFCVNIERASGLREPGSSAAVARRTSR